VSHRTTSPRFFDPKLPARFWDKVIPEPNSGCWLWLGYLGHNGYGRFHWTGGSDRNAHRLAYQILVGPLDDGIVVDHLCRTRCCVNPAHLDPVTPRENVVRGVSVSAKNAAKTHCKRGHVFDATNTRTQGSGRLCRLCEIARNRLFRATRPRKAS
jgi:hypothetical protein